MFGMKDAINKLKKTLTTTDSLSTTTSQSVSQPLGNDSNQLLQSKTDSNLLINQYDEDTLPPVNLIGYSSNTKTRLLTPEMCDEIRSLMPTRIQLYTDWTLEYSLEQHGASLNSLYKNITPTEHVKRRIGYVILFKDRENGIFGAYANEPWLPNEHKRYYGNGECFLWKLEKVPNVVIKQDGQNENIDDLDEKNDVKNEKRDEDTDKWQFSGYPYTGVNEFTIYCTSKFLSMGAGDGQYGLWCDDSLFHGVSYPCLTFGNEGLSKEGNKFHIMGLEVWRIG